MYLIIQLPGIEIEDHRAIDKKNSVIIPLNLFLISEVNKNNTKVLEDTHTLTGL